MKKRRKHAEECHANPVLFAVQADNLRSIWGKSMTQGYIFGFLYVIVISSASVWLNNLGQDFPVFMMLFCSALITCSFFIIVDCRNIVRNHIAIIKHPLSWFIMSLALLCLWTATYLGMICGAPDFFLALCFLTSAALASIIKRDIKKLFFCCVAGIICYYFAPETNTLVLSVSLLGGISAYIYSYSSYQFSQKSTMPALSVLSVRFYLLLVGTFIMVAYSPAGLSNLAVNWHAILILTVLAISHMVIPNFLSQSSLQILGANTFTFLATALPVTTFLISALVKKQWNSEMFFACLFVTVVLNQSGIIKLIRNRHSM